MALTDFKSDGSGLILGTVGSIPTHFRQTGDTSKGAQKGLWDGVGGGAGARYGYREGTSEGKRFRFSLGMISWEAATFRVREFESDGVREEIGVQRAVGKFLEDWDARGLSKHTRRRYRQELHEFVEWYGGELRVSERVDTKRDDLGKEAGAG